MKLSVYVVRVLVFSLLVGMAAIMPSCSPRAFAQSAVSDSTITVNARLVVLDVSVHDKDGKPVTDLSANDFRVFEDNKAQSLRSFEPPSAHALPAATAESGTAAVFDPAQPASFGQSPVTVLVLDQLNTHFADSSFARRELREYLMAQPELLPHPTTLMTVYENNFQQLQGFTRDRTALLKALEAAPVKNAWKLEASGSADWGPIERLQQSLNDVEQMAQGFALIPGRKDLIWVGGGFPTVDPTGFDSHDMQIVKDTLEHITNVLLSTRVTLYAVDPTSSAAGLVEITNADQADAATAMGGTMGVNSGSYDANADFDRISAITGGRVVRGRNDVSRQVAAAVDLSANFYTIGYAPTSANETAAQYRKIRVECLRPGTTVITRAGYYTEPAQQQRASETVAYDLSTAAESKLPLNGLRVSAIPVTSVAEPAGTYRVQVRASSLVWKQQQDGSSVAAVYVMGVAYNAKGKMLTHLDHPMLAHAKATADLRSDVQTADFIFTLPPAAKATRVRFVVRDSATGRMGSFDLPAAR